MAQPAAAIDWQNLWSTPEQRAQRHLQENDFDSLVEQAPDENWRAVGQYRQGEYDEAAQAFESLGATYNQATAKVHGGNYQEAIDLYDELLSVDPGNANAMHNRNIAEQLLELQQQQQQQSGEGDQSKQSEDGEKQEGSEQQQPGQQGSEQQQSSQQNQDSNQDSSSEQVQGQSAEQQEEQEEQARKAAEAMAAEREQDSGEENSEQNSEQNNDEQSQTASVADAPLSEQEQANEQWLRRIPDDPAGLLQRKLQNRHMSEYPEVRDSANPW